MAYFPGTAVAVAAAALVLAVTATSGRLFLSSAADAALQQELSRSAGVPPLRVVAYGSVADDAVSFEDGILQTAARQAVPRLGAGVLTIAGPQAQVSAVGRAAAHLRPAASQVQLAARDGFLANVHRLERVEGEGVWLADTTAAGLGVHAGATIAVQSGRQVATTRVAGVYRDLAKEPPAPYWAPLGGLIYPSGAEQRQPPPLLLASPALLSVLGRQLQAVGRVEWDFYLPPGRLTLPRAEDLAAGIQALQAELADPTSGLAVAVPGATADSPVPQLAARARDTQAALTGPVETISLSGRLLALALVAMAGVYGVRRRRSEMRVLSAQGVGAATLGARSALEAVPAAVLGGLAGWAGAIALARVLDPSPLLEAAALGAAGREVAFTLAAGIVLLAVAAGLAVAETTGERSWGVRGVLAGPLWEASVLVLAAASLYEITTRGGGPVQAGGGPPRVDRLLLLFPLLLIAGLAGLVSRGLGRLLAGKPARFGRWPPPLFLALRRLTTAPRLAMLLLTASAVAVGLLCYAGILIASTRATALEKARVFVGSDASGALAAPLTLPPGTHPAATVVERVQDATLLPGQTAADLLAVDPGTFARGAFWDRSFAAEPLGRLLRRLDADPGRRGRLPAIVAGDSVPPNPTLAVASVQLPVTVVSTTRAFPGMLGGRALVVVSAAGLNRALRAAGSFPEVLRPSYQVWVKAGGRDQTAPAGELRALGVAPEQAISAREVMRTPAFLAIAWTFGLLEALGLLAGLVTVAGLLLYQQSRQQAQAVAHALLGRMGLARRARRLSSAVEIATMLLLALVLGAPLAWLAAALVYRRLDPMPAVPPGPLLRLPLPLLGGVLLAALLVAWAGAALIQWRADRVNVAEVMRLAD